MRLVFFCRNKVSIYKNRTGRTRKSFPITFWSFGKFSFGCLVSIHLVICPSYIHPLTGFHSPIWPKLLYITAVTHLFFELPQSTKCFSSRGIHFLYGFSIPWQCEYQIRFYIVHQQKPAHRLTSFILFILILSPILLRQHKQFFKHPQPWFLQLPRIHQFPIMLHPRIQSPFLQFIFGKISAVSFYEGLHLMIVCHPSSFLIHTSKFLSDLGCRCRFLNFPYAGVSA